MDDVAVAATGEGWLPAAATGSATGERRPRAAPAGGLAARLYWLWPALLTLGYGVWGIRTPSLWADELATWGAVRLSWRSLYQLLGNVDAVVAPYYTLVKVWTSVAGTSTVALRLPSVGAMTVAAALVTVLGARLAGRWAGLLAGLAFAVTPTTSRYAQEARPYSFVILLAILATLLLVSLARRPSPGIQVGYALAVVALGAFHLMALLLLVAHGVAVWRRARWQWAISAGAGVAPLLPLAWLGYRQSAQISWIKPAHWYTLAAAPDTLFVAGSVAGFVIALAVLAFARRWEVLLLASWALAPVLVLYLAAQVTPVFWPRYLLYTAPAWVLLAALTLARLPRASAVAVVIALALVAHPTQFNIRAADGHSHGDGQAAAILTANEQPGDAIVYKADDQPEPWEARDLVARYVPPNRRPRDVFAVAPQRTDGRLQATECADLAACLDQAQPSRIWIIRFGAQNDPLAGLGQAKEALLRSRYRLDRLWQVKGLTIALCVPG